MDISTITSKIERFLSDKFLIDFGPAVNQETDLFKEGLIDSFGFIELISFLEKEFAVQLVDDELMSGNLNTLKGMAGLIEQKLPPVEDSISPGTCQSSATQASRIS